MSRQRKQVSKTSLRADVHAFSHDGRGIARVDGKTTFIQGALPTETVEFQYSRQKRDYDEGQLLKVIKPSIHRIQPRCVHYDVCGGCSLQHLNENVQIHEKEGLLLEQLKRIGHVVPKVVLKPLTSDFWRYRNKARLSVRYVEKKKTTLVGFRERNNPRYIANIEQCPVLHAEVGTNILSLRSLFDSLSKPQSIAQIEVAAGDEEVALIIRHLEELSVEDKEKIKQFAHDKAFIIFLQPGGEDSVHRLYPDTAPSYLKYSLPDEDIQFKFYPTDFTQVNAGLNRLMVKHAIEMLDLKPDDVVLDLFCGLGNFTLPIAKHCYRVMGVEGNQRMVERARMNANENELINAQFLYANLEEPRALDFLFSQSFDKVLLDPPRTGAFSIVNDIHTLLPKRIVYISCNPATLARDSHVLVHKQGYRLMAAGVMDMFPHTAHVESIALFEQ